MDKKTLHTVVSVVLGIAVFTIISVVILLMFDAVLADDTLEITSTSKYMDETVSYVKHSSIAVICIAIPMLVCYGLTYFAKSKKIFATISALISLVLIAMCIGFVFDLRSIVIEFDALRSTCYTVASAHFSKLIELLISCAFSCAYFTVIAIRAFLPEKATKQIIEPTTTNSEAVVPEKGE